MLTVTIMRPGQDAEVRELADGWSLGSPVAQGMLKEMVGGSDYEHVSVLHDERRADMFVDEESACKGLPRNDTATAIYRNYSLKSRPGTDPESLPAIYGPAVLFSRPVWR